MRLRIWQPRLRQQFPSVPGRQKRRASCRVFPGRASFGFQLADLNLPAKAHRSVSEPHKNEALRSHEISACAHFIRFTKSLDWISFLFRLNNARAARLHLRTSSNSWKSVPNKHNWRTQPTSTSLRKTDKPRPRGATKAWHSGSLGPRFPQAPTTQRQCNAKMECSNSRFFKRHFHKFKRHFWAVSHRKGRQPPPAVEFYTKLSALRLAISSYMRDSHLTHLAKSSQSRMTTMTSMTKSKACFQHSQPAMQLQGTLWPCMSSVSCHRVVVSCVSIHWPDLSDLSELSELPALQRDFGRLALGRALWTEMQMHESKHKHRRFYRQSFCRNVTWKQGKQGKQGQADFLPCDVFASAQCRRHPALGKTRSWRL